VAAAIGTIAEGHSMALYAFDGTWNEDQEQDERDSNVRKFFELSDEPDERKQYLKGIGTRLGWFGRLFGGVFGIGGRHRVKAAYEHLEKTWQPGEPIDVIGFSRGAAVALDFINEIAKRKGEQGAPQPPVRFLGLFDTVPAFGLPNVGLIEKIDFNFGKELTIAAGTVRHCAHAVALDERRNAFGITRVARAHEVWFRGCHSDIGGGNGNTKLSLIALRWMVRKAALCGVPVNEGRLRALALDTGVDPNARIKLPKDFIKNKFRDCAPVDRVHYTVGPIAGRLDRDDCNPFVFTVIETEADEANLKPLVL
jgi:uncharacterized protein (DUF2235 family)